MSATDVMSVERDMAQHALGVAAQLDGWLAAYWDVIPPFERDELMAAGGSLRRIAAAYGVTEQGADQ